MYLVSVQCEGAIDSYSMNPQFPVEAMCNVLCKWRWMIQWPVLSYPIRLDHIKVMVSIHKAVFNDGGMCNVCVRGGG